MKCKVWANQKVYSWRIAVPKEIIRELNASVIADKPQEPFLVEFRWASTSNGKICRYYEKYGYLFGLEIWRGQGVPDDTRPLTKFSRSFGFAINSVMAKAMIVGDKSLHQYLTENQGKKKRRAILQVDVVKLQEHRTGFDERAILFKLPSATKKLCCFCARFSESEDALAT